jgi:hypothetical protein
MTTLGWIIVASIVFWLLREAFREMREYRRGREAAVEHARLLYRLTMPDNAEKDIATEGLGARKHFEPPLDPGHVTNWALLPANERDFWLDVMEQR